MLYVDFENKKIGGIAKVKDIQKLGLIQASQKDGDSNVKRMSNL